MCHPCPPQVGGSYVAYKVLDSKHQIGNDIKWMRRLLPLKREMGKFYTEGGSPRVQRPPAPGNTLR